MRKRKQVGRSAKPERQQGPSETPATRPTPARKLRQTYAISEDVAERARRAAFALQGPPACLTLAGIAERALVAELDRLEKEYNAGKPFPKTASGLRPGRKVGG